MAGKSYKRLAEDGAGILDDPQSPTLHRPGTSISAPSLPHQPYFVQDESLLEAITTASYRGVAVELFVSELAGQFVVQHSQSSYYEELLNAGVRIYLYP